MSPNVEKQSYPRPSATDYIKYSTYLCIKLKVRVVAIDASAYSIDVTLVICSKRFLCVLLNSQA